MCDAWNTSFCINPSSLWEWYFIFTLWTPVFNGRNLDSPLNLSELLFDIPVCFFWASIDCTCAQVKLNCMPNCCLVFWLSDLLVLCRAILALLACFLVGRYFHTSWLYVQTVLTTFQLVPIYLGPLSNSSENTFFSIDLHVWICI